MQTIKGLAVLLLVAAVVFAIVGMSDLKSQAGYAAKMKNSIVASTVKTGGRAATEMATNVVDQVRQKIKNANL